MIMPLPSGWHFVTAALPLLLLAGIIAPAKASLIQHFVFLNFLCFNPICSVQQIALKFNHSVRMIKVFRRAGDQAPAKNHQVLCTWPSKKINPARFA
jgi:hypothetical protein